jgi:hypothetical protein
MSMDLGARAATVPAVETELPSAPAPFEVIGASRCGLCTGWLRSPCTPPFRRTGC